MSRIAYVNGRYVPHGEAAVHVEDRGYQFADGVYEVIAVMAGRQVDAGPHLDRLERSLRELAIEMPMTRRALQVVIRETIRRNRVRDGIVYVQITRGVAPRDHPFPENVRPAVVVTARAMPAKPRALVEEGVAVVTIPDIRWRRCDIKSIALLPNVLGKQAAREAGAYEAWLVDDDGLVTEGTSTNAWIVTADGELVTRSLSNAILSGITRRAVIEIARRRGMPLVERAFSVEEAKSAREAFITSTTSHVLPVTRIDDAVVGNGRAGTLSLALRDRYLEYAREAAE